MRALFNNQIWTATLSADHEDANYPLVNVRDAYLYRIFKSTEASDTILATFATAQTIDCVYLSFTNATTITAKLYNASGILLATIDVDATELCETFTAVESVKYIELELAHDTDDVYLGALGVGSAYVFPYFAVNYGPDPIDNSVVKKSRNGQRLMEKVEILRRYSLGFEVDSTDYAAIRTLIHGQTLPIFIDLFEESRALEPVFYGTLAMGGVSRESYTYQFTLTAEEAR